MQPTKSRVLAVDALRGLVMIVMALDHARDFIHAGAMTFQPEDLTRTTALLFFTRWITHICAPVFMFTAGLGAYFWMSRGRTRYQLSRFLWTRGLWLIVVELLVIRLAMNFSLSPGILILSVIWALGLSMVALGFLIHLPVRMLAALSIAVIVLHNLADRIAAAQFGSAAGVWNIVHQQGVFKVGGALVLVAYPLVPWVAVMAVGFCFGPIMILDPARRRRWMTQIGLACIVRFSSFEPPTFTATRSPGPPKYPE